METTLEVLRHIRKEQGNASTESIAKTFNSTEDQANELIDYLEEKGLIKEPTKMLDGSRIAIKISADGLDLITNPK